MNFVSQLFNTNSAVKAWHLLKHDYYLNNNSYFPVAAVDKLNFRKMETYH